MGSKRAAASHGIRGNSAYFAFVLAYAVCAEITAAVLAVASGMPYRGGQGLALALLFGLILLPLALVVVFLNWWFHFSRTSYIVTAAGTFLCFNWVGFGAPWPGPVLALWLTVVPTGAMAIWWEASRRKAVAAELAARPA